MHTHKKIYKKKTDPKIFLSRYWLLINNININLSLLLQFFLSSVSFLQHLQSLLPLLTGNDGNKHDLLQEQLLRKVKFSIKVTF